MRSELLIGLIVAAAQVLAQEARGPTGTVSGRIYDADSGAPLRDFPIEGTRTDGEGRFSAKLTAGAHTIQILGDRVWPPLAIVNVTVEAGKELAGIDIRVRLDGEISGRVLDEDKDPIAGMRIHIIGREYYAGALRYFSENTATTDDRGEYHLRNVRAGRGVLLVAEPTLTFDTAVSNAPAEPKLRLPVNRATFYPNSESVQGAALVTLRSGEQRDGMVISVRRTPAYCLSALLTTAGAPASLNFKLTDEETGSANMVPGSSSSGPGRAASGPDGKIRLCGLYPSRYRLAAYRQQGTTTQLFGSLMLTIAKEDIGGLRIPAEPPIDVPVEVNWISDPPDPNVPARFILLPRAVSNDAMLLRASQTGVPGQFSLPALQTVEYLLQPSVGSAASVPNGYVSDVTYGGQSIFHLPLRVAGSSDARLRVLLGNDGGSISVTTQPGARIIVMPGPVSSGAILQDAMVTLDAGPSGKASTRSLAPGKYYVIATNDLIDNVPETIEAILAARAHAAEVQVGARATASVTVEPKPLR